MEKEKFDFEAFRRDAIVKLRNKQPLSGKEGVLRMSKKLCGSL